MVLENKLGIADPVALTHEGERVSKAAAVSLYLDGTLDGLAPGTFSTLSTIHECLFGEILYRAEDL